MAGSPCVQVPDDFLGSEPHTFCATLSVSGNGVPALGDNIAVPSRLLGTQRGRLFQYGRELEWLTLSGKLYVVSHAVSFLVLLTPIFCQLSTDTRVRLQPITLRCPRVRDTR